MKDQDARDAAKHAGIDAAAAKTLATQHYHTLQKRMDDLDARIFVAEGEVRVLKGLGDKFAKSLRAVTPHRCHARCEECEREISAGKG